ncbi:MAG TPA: chaperone modulator CbpM [Albitalea sp.]
MAETSRSVVHAVIVEDELRFTLEDLCRACRAEAAQVVALVEEGVLEPEGRTPEDWRFAGPSLARARAALRLARDLELGVAGTALVMDLLDEIEALRARLRRAGIR